jgi:hypothetical protein
MVDSDVGAHLEGGLAIAIAQRHGMDLAAQPGERRCM